MPEFTIKEGDTRPVFEHTLERNGSTIDLRNATGVDFLLRSEYGGDPFINSPTTLEDAANGKVSYRFEPSDMVPEGTHHAEFVIDWSDGGTQTVPKRGYIEIEVTEPIDRDIDPQQWDAPDATVTTLHVDELRVNTVSEIGVTSPIDFGQGANVNGAAVATMPDLDSFVGNPLQQVLDANQNSITNLPTPTTSADSATKGYVDSEISGVSSSGVSNPLQEALDANQNSITNLPTPTASADSATKGYVDTEISSNSGVQNPMQQALDANSNTITGLPTPVNPSEAASKSYVDGAVFTTVSAWDGTSMTIENENGTQIQFNAE